MGLLARKIHSRCGPTAGLGLSVVGLLVADALALEWMVLGSPNDRTFVVDYMLTLASGTASASCGVGAGQYLTSTGVTGAWHQRVTLKWYQTLTGRAARRCIIATL